MNLPELPPKHYWSITKGQTQYGYDKVSIIRRVFFFTDIVVLSIYDGELQGKHLSVARAEELAQELIEKWQVEKQVYGDHRRKTEDKK